MLPWGLERVSHSQGPYCSRCFGSIPSRPYFLLSWGRWRGLLLGLLLEQVVEGWLWLLLLLLWLLPR